HDTHTLHTFPTRRSSDLSITPNGRSYTERIILRNAILPNLTSRAKFARPANRKRQLVQDRPSARALPPFPRKNRARARRNAFGRSEEHTSELQSPYDLVC